MGTARTKLPARWLMRSLAMLVLASSIGLALTARMDRERALRSRGTTDRGAVAASGLRLAEPNERGPAAH